MGVGAAIGAATSIAGGIMSRNAAKDAASQQNAQIQKGLDFQQSVYNQGKANLSPWIGSGQSALQQLMGFYGLPGGNASGATQGFQQFQQTPFYQFAADQGNLGINRQLASMGLIGSGAALKDASKFNTGMASQGLMSYLTGLSGMSSGGMGAAGTLMGQGNTSAQSVMSGTTNQGISSASGTIGGNNALQKGIGGATAPFTSSSFGNGFLGGNDPSNGSSSSYNMGSWIGNQFGYGNPTTDMWANDINAYNSNWNNFGSEWGYK